MKPLSVLVLVLVAVAALFFVITNLPEGDPTDLGGIDPGSTPVVEPTTDPGDLPGPESGANRASVETPTPESPRVGLVEGYANALVGTVETEDGQPLADAKVILTRTSSSSLIFVNDPVDRSGDRRTTTAADGSFSFANLEPYDAYALEVTHDDYTRVEISPVPIVSEGEHVEGAIVMGSGAKVFGIVYDETKLGVSGATLHLDGMFFRPGGRVDHDKTVVSDNRGYYEFKNVEVGHKALTVEAEGYGKAFINGLAIPDDQNTVEQNVTLEIAEMICGRVYDQLQQPVEGATVLGIAYSTSNQQCRDQAVSDAKGEFCLSALNSGTYTLQVSKPGYKSENNLRVETGNTNVVVELRPQASVSGRVLDATSKEPVTAFQIVLRQTYENHPATSQTETKGDFRSPDGSYQLADVKPGNYVVEARAKDYAPSFSDPFRVVQGQAVAGINVHLTQGGSITGVVLAADGTPRARAQIETFANDWTNSEFDRILGDMLPTNVSKRKTRTDEEGRFTLDNLKPETYQIRVSAPGHTEMIRQDIYVTEGKDTPVGDLRLLRGGKVTGLVLDAAGQPVKNAEVAARVFGQGTGQLPRFYKVRSDGNGRYTLSNVHPGNYMITAQPQRQAQDDILLGVGQNLQSQKELKVTNGQTLEIDMKLGT